MSWATQSHIWKSQSLLMVGESHAGLLIQSRWQNNSFNSAGGLETLGARSTQQKSTINGTAYRNYEVNIQQTRFTPAWAFGLAKNWTVAAKLPIIQMSGEVKQKITGPGGTREVQTAFAPKTRNSRYSEVSGSVQRNRVGQFQLISKHTLAQSRKSKLLVYESLKFPTAESEDLDYLIYAEPPPENYGLGLGLSYFYNTQSKIGLRAQTEFTHYLSDDVYARQQDGFLTEEQLDRQPGQEVHAEIASQYNWKRNASIGLGYRYQYQFESEYKAFEDNIFASEEQKKSSMYLTIAMDASRLLGRPLQTHLEWENTLGGANVQGADTLSLGLSSRF